MSVIFTPERIGAMETANRLVRSATYEGMAGEDGIGNEKLVGLYRNLAAGGAGLIITGIMNIHPTGRAMGHQVGIYDDRMIPGLRELADAVHDNGSKVVFQLNHAGRQTTKKEIGQTPIGPSAKGRDKANMVKPREMTETDIEEMIGAFERAARRAAEAGADGVQIHAAHGYLVNQFLSPFFNHRKDSWGGSDENRFRFLKEVVVRVRKVLPEEKPLMVKLNSNDFTPKQGITPALAARYAGWLSELGIDGLEVSCGTAGYSFMNVFRGEVPVEELVEYFPAWQKPVGRMVLKSMVGKFDLEEGYNLEAAKVIKPALNGIPLILVGGMRRVSHIEEVLDKGYADLVSMARPLVREPDLVNKFRSGDSEAASCVSCSKCLAAVMNGKPLRCYR